MSVFVDTSALYSLLDSADPTHQAAVATFTSLKGEELVTHSYVLVEATSLVQRRLGVHAARALWERLLRPVRVVWVGEEVHVAAVNALLASHKMEVSLVDHTSFVVMRREAIATAFAFDADFAVEGFETLPR